MPGRCYISLDSGEISENIWPNEVAWNTSDLLWIHRNTDHTYEYDTIIQAEDRVVFDVPDHSIVVTKVWNIIFQVKFATRKKSGLIWCFELGIRWLRTLMTINIVFDLTRPRIEGFSGSRTPRLWKVESRFCSSWSYLLPKKIWMDSMLLGRRKVTGEKNTFFNRLVTGWDPLL